MSVWQVSDPSEQAGHDDHEDPNTVGNRERWKDRKGRIYEWDYKKGEVEIYDKRGKNHKGGFNPDTGKEVSPADPTRTVEP